MSSQNVTNFFPDKKSFEQFLTHLKIQVKDCSFDADEMIRDQIVIGYQSEKVREKLICKGSDLTLEKGIDTSRTHKISGARL